MLVDTSIWSLLLHRKKAQNNPKVLFLIDAINNEQNISMAGIIYQEVLQGIKDDFHYLKVKNYLDDFEFLETNKTTHDLAARILRICRSKGISAHTNDCLIAALSLQHKQPLLTCDHDFTFISKHTTLELI